jgi:hypothetical protein
MSAVVLSLAEVQARLHGIASSEWPRLLQAILRLPEAARQPQSLCPPPVLAQLLVWDWLARIGLSDASQRRFLLEAMRPQLTAWAEQPVSRFHIVVADGQFATWAGSDVWVNLTDESQVALLPVEPITTIAGDLLAMLNRLGAACAPASACQ